MPEISLDFGDVGKIPDEGTYRFTIVKAKVKTNKAKDGRYINLQLALTDAPPEIANFEGHTVWDMTSLKKAGLWKTQEMLEAATGEEWAEDGMVLDANDDNELEFLEDQTVIASCVHDLDLREKPVLKIKTYYQDNGEVEIGVASEEESD